MHKFEDALKETVNWFLENELWWQKIKKKKKHPIFMG